MYILSVYCQLCQKTIENPWASVKGGGGKATFLTHMFGAPVTVKKGPSLLTRKRLYSQLYEENGAQSIRCYEDQKLDKVGHTKNVETGQIKVVKGGCAHFQFSIICTSLQGEGAMCLWFAVSALLSAV